MSHKAETPDAMSALAKRFSTRLWEALNNKGFPLMNLDRARALAAHIDLESDIASDLIRGQMLPNMPVLMKLCELLDRQPGYFLDESVPVFPDDTRLVAPMSAGEPVVVRIPDENDRAWGSADAEWTYMRAQGEMGFGVTSGHLVVNFVPRDGVPLVVGRLYLLASYDKRFEVLRCTDIKGGSAVMQAGHGHGDGVPRLVPTGSKIPVLKRNAMERAGYWHFGMVSASIAPAYVMCRS